MSGEIGSVGCASFYRCQLINYGAMLGYPELPPGYRIEGSPAWPMRHG